MITGDQARLSGSLHHHLCHVLRLSVGTPLLVVDEQGNQYRGRIEQFTREEVLVELMPTHRPTHAISPRITLIYGMSRRSRTEWVLQKATELGVDALYLAPCERSVTRLPRVDQKQRRWEEIINQATRQSGRPDVPRLIIHPDFTAALSRVPSTEVRLLATMDAPHISMHADTLGEGTANITLAVGPEGGFTPAEITAAQNHGFALVSLGRQVLRTETAALSMVTIAAYLCGKL